MTGIQSIDLSAGILRPLLWQHNQATSLRSLLDQKKAWVDANNAEFWTDWYRDVFNLKTANAFGCQVWARILGIRLAPPPPEDGGERWGFATDDVNFDNGPFANSTGVVLTVEQQRLVLRLRWYQMTTRPSVTDINRILADVFSEFGTVYVLDPLDMSSLTYVFTFEPDANLVSVFRDYDLLPRPSTVGADYTTTAREEWGFGPFNKNFDNAPFVNRNL